MAAMAFITFDFLAPIAAHTLVHQRFTALTALLLRDAHAAKLEVTLEENPQLPEEIVQQLQQSYRSEHEEAFDAADDDETLLAHHGVYPLEQLLPARIVIEVVEPKASVNQLAMLYARILTPPAALPNSALETLEEQRYEVPATFPWSVAVHP